MGNRQSSLIVKTKGAAGILGREIVLALGKDQKQWSTIHAISRSQKEEYPSTVKHRHVDLTGDANSIANELKGVEAEYLFFAAYIQKDSEQESWDVNGALLKNFLEALKITGANKKLKRVLLVTGAKQYGVHLGQVKNPMEESDPWLTGAEWPPNFYYNQQEILKKQAADGGWEWVVTYPNDVIGMARGNFMNLSTSLGIYATINKEINQELPFPGGENFYTRFDTFTSSKLHAKFALWAILAPKAANRAFNVVNGDVQSWQNLWPKLAARFKCKIPADQFTCPSPLASSTTLSRPPIDALASEIGLKGTAAVKPSTLDQRIKLSEWSKDDKVKKVWDDIAAREGLEQKAFEQATWAFLDFVLGRSYDLVLNMTEARKMGFEGFVDTWEALDETFTELEEAGVLPKIK
ncbi:hypothetical protein VE00_01989 [Pseudogymnoascus sp. WSF 3629]|nr:hypothetical protein VE00_01989 [Pseudogymnoascus sp. WSF 3629]